MSMMRCDLLGLLENAAQSLDRRDTAGTAFALREVAENITRLGRNPELWPDFAQLYCLLPADLDRKGRA